MSATGMIRGFDVTWSTTLQAWLTDEGCEVTPDAPCAHCRLAPTPEGHDACLGTISGAVAACCGHGRPGAAYVLHADRILHDAQPTLDGETSE